MQLGQAAHSPRDLTDNRRYRNDGRWGTKFTVRVECIVLPELDFQFWTIRSHIISGSFFFDFLVY